MHVCKRLFFAFTLSMACLGAPVTVTAQTSGQAEGVLEEVVVTARRRAESIQDVPASVTSIDQEMLRDLRLDDIVQMMRLVPNATVPLDSEGINTFIVIRGIRQPDPQIEPNFGLYRNGIFYGGSRTNLRAQVDVERVEVMRGSQGGLYGRNSSGGAVNIVYGTPKQEFDAYAAARYGRYDRTDFEGMVNVPVSDALAVRAAGWWFETDGGQFDNDLLGEELDFSEDKGIRLSGLWDISERWSLWTTVEYSDVSGPSFLTYSPEGVIDFLSLIGGPGQSRPPESPSSIRRDIDESTDLEQTYVAGNLEWETELGTFNLLASYRDYEMEGTRDGDSADFQPSDGFFASSSVRRNSEDVDNTYVELLWTSAQDQALTWITGVSYYEEDFEFERRIDTIYDFDVTPLDPAVTGEQLIQVFLPVNSPLEVESTSVFAELNYGVTPDVDVFGSLRYIRDEKSVDFEQFMTGDDPAAVAAIQGAFGGLFAALFPDFQTNFDDTFTDWLPGGGVRYQVNENVNVYATIQTGMRAGGFNTTTTVPSNIPYDSEESITYEIGAKSTLWDQRVELNASVFRFDQDDYLLFVEDPVNPFFSALVNVGEAETWGAELELRSQLTHWLFLGLAYGYLDPEVTEGVNFGQDISGNMIPRVREHSASVVLSMDYPLDYRNLRLVGNINATGEYGGYENPNETNKIDDLEVVDVTLGVASDHWRVTGFVDNVFDETVTLFTFGFPNVQDQTRDRRWGVEVAYRF